MTMVNSSPRRGLNPFELVLSHLAWAKPVTEARQRWLSACPAHADTGASLSISAGKAGQALIRCRAGCPPRKIIAALGLTLSDLMPGQETGPIGQAQAPSGPIGPIPGDVSSQPADSCPTVVETAPVGCAVHTRSVVAKESVCTAHPTASDLSPPISPSSTAFVQCLADVEAREVQWLWPGRVGLGRITLLVGRPGEGKSFLTTDMAARVSTGRSWPDGSPGVSGSVILISVEDDPRDTIGPRLAAHGADLRRIHLFSMVRHTKPDGRPYEAMFSLADLPVLEGVLREHPDCKLVVVDPIGSFLGGRLDSYRDSSVRSVLAPVTLLAEKYGPAILVVAHRRKSPGRAADDLALGSVAFTGVSRAVWHLSHDPRNKARRLLLAGKNNLGAPPDGLAFTIAGDPPALHWEQDAVNLNADEALAEEARHAARKPGPSSDSRDRAVHWLADLLAEGPMTAGQVQEEAEANGYAMRTVHRAKDILGIRPLRDGVKNTRIWRLPDASDTQEGDGRDARWQE